MQWNLFLSSTVRDFEAYRGIVQEWCRIKADTTCQLSEDGWTGGYDDTLAKCEQRVLEADAFILLAGYWYGSVPPGRDRSVTHLEFDHALKKWGQAAFPPMAVMMPEPGSRAHKSLQGTAAKILQDEQRSNPHFDPAKHHVRLAAFHATLTGSWRTVKRFKDGPDLAGWASCSCLCWKGQGRTFLAASQGAAAPAHRPALPPQVSDEQLGQLGRQPQLGAVKAALASVAGRPAVPALALIVHGDDAAGQRAFLSALPGFCLKGLGPRQQATRLPIGQTDPALLPAWIAQTLGLPGGRAVHTPEELAERLAPELRSRPLYFILDRIGDLAGGATAFREQFWLPLYWKLHRLRAAQPFSHRLVAIVADYGEEPSLWLGASTEIKPPAGSPDYTRLLRLPRLENLEPDDLYVWFDEQDVPDEPTGRRAALKDRALSNSKGAVDGAPLHVFERLRGERLWPEGENE